jgi:NitT/TauT family transport system permease protein
MTRQTIKNAVYPLLGIAIILAAWQTYTQVFAMNRIVLPSPLDILQAGAAHWDTLLRESWPTFLESVLGFLLAVVIGIPFAVCVASSRVLNLTLYPILIAMQSIPKVAIAPIILVWFGLGMQSKLVIAFLVAFFPIVVDTRRAYGRRRPGFSSSRARCALRRRRSFSRSSFLRLCRSSLTGAKVAVTLAVIRRRHRRIRRLDRRARQSAPDPKFAARQPARLGGAGLAERARHPAVRGCRRRRTDGDALVADRAALNAQC